MNEQHIYKKLIKIKINSRLTLPKIGCKKFMEAVMKKEKKTDGSMLKKVNIMKESNFWKGIIETILK